MKKTKKDNSKKDVIAELKDEFKRHTGVLMEHMTKEVKTVAEGHSAIMRKLGEHDKRFDSHDKRFNHIEQKLTEHDTKFAGIDQRLTRVEMVTTDINGRVKAVEKKLDENLNNYETRIAKLEEKVHT